MTNLKQINTKTSITINDQHYNSWDEVPAEYQHLRNFGDNSKKQMSKQIKKTLIIAGSVFVGFVILILILAFWA